LGPRALLLALGRGLGRPWLVRLLLGSAAGSLAALLIAGLDSAGAAPDTLYEPYLLATVIAFGSLAAALCLSLWLDRAPTPKAAGAAAPARSAP
jgi:hypothetical protein